MIITMTTTKYGPYNEYKRGEVYDIGELLAGEFVRNGHAFVGSDNKAVVQDMLEALDEGSAYMRYWSSIEYPKTPMTREEWLAA